MRFGHSDRGEAHVGPCILAALLILAAPASVHAQVIDDFETGSFLLQGTVFDSGIQTPLPITHCIATARSVEMFINGTESGAQLDLVSPDDEVQMVWGNGGGRIEFDYDPGPTDLTFVHHYDALRVRLTVAVAAGRVEVALTDASAATVLVSQTIVGPGDYVFPFGDFAGIDPSDIEFIEMNLDVPDFGDYHISDFRAVDSGVSAAMVDVTDGATAGPPYPTDPIRMEIWYPDASGSDHPQEVLDLVAHAVTNAGAPPPTGFMAMDSGGGTGMPGTQASCMVEDMGPDPTGHRVFDLMFQVMPATTQMVKLKELPTRPPPDDQITASFGVMFSSYVDGAGEAARVDHWLTFDTPDGSGFSFSNVMVMLGDPDTHPNSFHLMFEMTPDGMVAARRAGPLFEMLLGADVFDYGENTSSPAWTGSTRLELSAHPSVMSSTTELWMSRSLDRQVRLGVFDVAGRLIQTLSVPAGREFAVWDGRDRRGIPVASGVYLVRPLDLADAGSTKLAKVR